MSGAPARLRTRRRVINLRRRLAGGQRRPGWRRRVSAAPWRHLAGPRDRVLRRPPCVSAGGSVASWRFPWSSETAWPLRAASHGEFRGPGHMKTGLCCHAQPLSSPEIRSQEGTESTVSGNTSGFLCDAVSLCRPVIGTQSVGFSLVHL